MPITNRIVKYGRFKFKRCPNCGRDMENSWADCCVMNRNDKLRGQTLAQRAKEVEKFSGGILKSSVVMPGSKEK